MYNFGHILSLCRSKCNHLYDFLLLFYGYKLHYAGNNKKENYVFFNRPVILQKFDDAPVHTSNSLKWLWFLIKPYKWLFLMLTANRAGRMVFFVGIQPLLIAKIIESFESGVAFTDPTVVWNLVMIFAVSSIVIHLMLLITIDDLRLYDRLSRNVRLLSLNHLNKLSARWHEQADSGSKLQRVMTGSEGLKQMIRLYFQQLLWFFAGVVGTSIALFYMDVDLKYIGYFLGFMFTYVGFSWWSNIFISRGYDKRNLLLEALIGKVYEFVNASLTVKTFNLGKHILDHAKEGETKGYNQISRIYVLDILRWIILNFIGLFWICLILYVSINEALAKEITIAALALIAYQTLTVWDLVENFTNVYGQYIDFNSGFKRLIELLRQPIQHDEIDSEELNIEKGEISFNNVKFSYNEKESVFDGLNLKIKAGEKVGVVGKSGSGKSTLAKLLLRFYDPSENEITIDRQNIRKVNQDSLRQNIAIIPQDVSLFNHSILDNIRYGRLDATDEEVMEASRLAHADEFIQKLPEGYETLVGERGLKLSGGQRQRIAIARAILKDAPILILDEATSALDTESERLIQDSLEKLMANKTVIAIAHRLSTISSLDRILVFDKGAMVEDGTHDELLKKEGVYANLWSMQSNGMIDD